MNQRGMFPSSLSSKSSQSYAPFGSVSPRGRKKKKTQTLLQPGPGAYDVSLPIIRPIIQTIKKKNNNIIVKLSHIGTSSFQGERQRFEYEFANKNSYCDQVGPGLYSPEKSLAILENSPMERYTEKFKLPKRKQAGIQLTKFIKNRERKAATFSEVKRIEIEDYVQMPIVQEKESNKDRNPLKIRMNKIRGPDWSMMKQERIKSVKSPYENIGPGQYYHSGLQENVQAKKARSISEQYPSSYFRSQSVRSFFDNICFETNQQKKALIRQTGGYKSSSVGPGSYQMPNKSIKQNRFQFFGSTEERRLG